VSLFMKPKLLSWNVRGLYELESLDSRMQISFVYRNLNWSSFSAVLCIVCGGVNMWIGATRLIRQLLMESCLYGIGGLWR